MEEKDTAYVLNQLNNATSRNQGANLIKDETLGFKNISFSEFYNNYLASHPEIKNADVVNDSGITRQYFSQIVNGQKNANRDRIIAICFALSLTPDETDHALIYANHKKLYVKDKRDLLIYNELRWKSQGQGMYDNVTLFNLFLVEQGQKPLEI